MSYILEDMRHHFWHITQHISGPLRKERQDIVKNILQPFDATKNIDKTLTGVSEYPIFINQKKDRKIIHVLLNRLFRGVSFDMIIDINTTQKKTRIRYKPLKSSQSYLKVTSGQRIKFAAKQLVIFNKMKPQIFNQNKFSIQIHSGSLQIENPVHYYFNFDDFNLTNTINFLVQNFITWIKSIQQPLVYLLQLSNVNPKSYLDSLILKRDGSKLRKMSKYSKMMNIQLNMGTQETVDEQSFNIKLRNELESFQSTSANIIDIEQDVSSIQLYCNQNLSFSNKSIFAEFNCSFNDIQTKDIKNKLQVPQITSMVANNQRTFIVNHIKLTKAINQKFMNKIATGGFATIFLGEVQHIPISSHQIGKQQLMQECSNIPIKKQNFIVKRQKPHNRVYRSRILHEKEVLLRVKSALSVFIPKYYFIFNPPEENKFDLVQEHIYIQSNTLNLEDYIKKFKPSCSQFSMVFFAFSIIQGLRCLKDYKIAHLDLKPSNVMIGKKMTVKLIDFGESYYPELKNHQPGISMPYSAPENYTVQQSYTHKNDVFSFGVLLHYLLTSRYPFYIFDEKKRQKYFKDSSISDIWYFSPQGMQQYGQHNIYPFIQILIGKCLHPNPRCRPELEWISLMLRQYLEYTR